ncbi:hypothetical protein [Paenibacillus periandrae]|uniref:hypothetical protein n=1 Tax=Paenibacillus periandrae TaxID=1761741 RepID=UPI001F093959|nr:hypothetical protein [Paenibacillus periandrae]
MLLYPFEEGFNRQWFLVNLPDSIIGRTMGAILWLYGDHAITGVGYQENSSGQQNLIVHGGWSHSYTDTIYPMSSSTLQDIMNEYAN